MKRIIIAFAYMCFVGIEVFAQPVLTIGIVSDGENSKLSEARTALIREIRKASEGEYVLSFPNPNGLMPVFLSHGSKVA